MFGEHATANNETANHEEYLDAERTVRGDHLGEPTVNMKRRLVDDVRQDYSANADRPPTVQ